MKHQDRLDAIEETSANVAEENANPLVATFGSISQTLIKL